MENNYVLTQEGKEKLEQELHFLETEKRAEIGDRIRVAREFGDISENSEYDDACFLVHVRRPTAKNSSIVFVLYCVP